MILSSSILAVNSSLILNGKELSLTNSLGRFILCLDLYSYSLTLALFTMFYTYVFLLFITLVYTFVHTKIINTIVGIYLSIH